MHNEQSPVEKKKPLSKRALSTLGAAAFAIAGAGGTYAYETHASEPTPAETVALTHAAQTQIDTLAAGTASKLLKHGPLAANGKAQATGSSLQITASLPLSRGYGRSFDSYTIQFAGKPHSTSSADINTFLSERPHLQSFMVDQGPQGTSSVTVDYPASEHPQATVTLPAELMNPDGNGYVKFGSETPQERIIAVVDGSIHNNDGNGVPGYIHNPVPGRTDPPTS